jgi:hypothetical protein
MHQQAILVTGCTKMGVGIQGRELLELIELLGDLEWAKYETRYATILIKGNYPLIEDRSDRPPYASFRFVRDKPEVIEKLHEGVKSYKGNIEWVMDGYQRHSFPGTTNRTIQPKKMANSRQPALNSGLSLGQYMAKVDPMFAPLAYDDLKNLTAHLQRIFFN